MQKHKGELHLRLFNENIISQNLEKVNKMTTNIGN